LFFEITAAMTRPIGPRIAHNENQKQPPRPFVVAIHAPRTPQSNQTGIPCSSFMVVNRSRLLRLHRRGSLRGMSEAQKLDLGDVELSCEVYGKGDVVLCAHGFPDDAATFRGQTGPLTERGFQVVCPTMRGYAPSGVSKSGRYDAESLGRDLVALADVFSPDKPIRLIGHDWGAVAAYAATALAPHRFSHLVTIAVPHVRSTLGRLVTPAQLRRSWYMAYFQLKGIAERGLAKNNLGLIDRLWRDWSPDYHASADDLEHVKRGIKDRIEPVLGYYRAFFSPRSLLGASRTLLLQQTTVPAMHIHGEDDGCIGVELTLGMERHFSKGIVVQRIRGAGHFVHLEVPEIVNPILLDFLTTTAT